MTLIKIPLHRAKMRAKKAYQFYYCSECGKEWKGNEKKTNSTTREILSRIY